MPPLWGWKKAPFLVPPKCRGPTKTLDGLSHSPALAQCRGSAVGLKSPSSMDLEKTGESNAMLKKLQCVGIVLVKSTKSNYNWWKNSVAMFDNKEGFHEKNRGDLW